MSFLDEYGTVTFEHGKECPCYMHFDIGKGEDGNVVVKISAISLTENIDLPESEELKFKLALGGLTYQLKGLHLGGVIYLESNSNKIEG